MSRLLVIFMIFLLPLCGWAGDLMGVQMATSNAALHMAAEMPPDCPMLAAADATHEEDKDVSTQPSPVGKGCCASCELCTPVAELAHGAVELVAMAEDAKPVIDGVEFISAPRALSFKPPIS